ncbi:hypothetical protein K474DRAFT_1676021 [Panus rudis PR-1116 ss-1]|nr:hypothetical protein K474DRAFT_1676021 [Panus rudis PR-1116 ss-1]
MAWVDCATSGLGIEQLPMQIRQRQPGTGTPYEYVIWLGSQAGSTSDFIRCSYKADLKVETPLHGKWSSSRRRNLRYLSAYVRGAGSWLPLSYEFGAPPCSVGGGRGRLGCLEGTGSARSDQPANASRAEPAPGITRGSPAVRERFSSVRQQLTRGPAPWLPSEMPRLSWDAIGPVAGPVGDAARGAQSGGDAEARCGSAWGSNLGQALVGGAVLGLVVFSSSSLATVCRPPSSSFAVSFSYFVSLLSPSKPSLVTDWHPPRDLTMDAPSATPPNPNVPRQRSSPANDHSGTPSPIPQQQPYPYPVQQQQAGWNAAHAPQQYYPSFYQNPHQQPYGMHGSPHSTPNQIQNPYYDPANVQFAQWAYQQQMMFHQAHQLSHVPPPMSGQRNRAGSASTPGEYFPQGQIPNYNVFPSGTPPAHPAQLPNGYPAGQGDHRDHQQQSQYGGFHPYRRPNRQGSQEPTSNTEWRSPTQSYSSPPVSPPYVRADAAGSSTSVNSNSGGPNGTRQRTNSTQGSSTAAGSQSSHGKAISSNGHGRGGSTTSVTSSSSAPRPHHRTSSSSSNTPSVTPRTTSTTPALTTVPATHSTATLRKPSPLSQGTFTAAEKRMSRDDSDLATMMEPATGSRSAGLKGRLRRALSLNANSALKEEDEGDPASVSKSRLGPSPGPSGSSQVLADDESTATVQKKKSRSLFNSRMNRSTDNISLSSTMSSASMVIRKLGSIGKLTRRNSLAGITSLFKDKKGKDGEPEAESSGKKSKKKKGEKGSVADPSVSLATAELDREFAEDMPPGLSPAAMLARQHTLKSNAEAAARAKAEQEAKAAAAAAAAAQSGSGEPVPTTWEKNTTNRQGEGSPARFGRANEDGRRVHVEDDSDSGSDDDHHHSQGYNMDSWEDDEDWDGAQDEEDITIRQGIDNVMLDDEEMEPWAINVRRSVERTKVPTKGILKTRADGAGYEQDAYLPQPNPTFARNRSNSYDSPPAKPGSAQGPSHVLAQPDPDQIDGLHKHSHSSSHGQSSSSFLGPLSFETDGSGIAGAGVDSPKEISESSTSGNTSTSGEKTLFSLPNSSAPALSTMFSSNPPTLSHRSATAPAKRLAFATNLSVYDTFPANVYDRRSEPATWSRLTPALAQRIKEELNSYKMEEMEVHVASRVHTQFFV